MSFKCGIVGLPNVGKSTLFNALTNSNKAQAANFPFCTIDPNVGVVAVPDIRLDNLAKISKSKKIINTTISFVDIAGLVKGASKGEGLGNKFLSHIREVDAIIHMIRCFESDDIQNVNPDVDPVRDLEIIETEMMLASIISVSIISRSLTGSTSGFTFWISSDSKHRIIWIIASTSLMWDRNLLPRPSPFDAPLTNPAISTKDIVVLIIFFDFEILAKLSNLISGTATTPTFGSIVQKGKFAAWALFEFVKALNKVDLPTLGKPTIPHLKLIIYCLLYLKIGLIFF